MFKSGYVAVVGKPNAGKSSLINCLVKQKVAIVSPKPQTTRNNILGILTDENYQIVFVDTPGIHKSKNALDKYMMKNVRTATSGCEIILYVHDGCKNITPDQIDYIKSLKQKNESKIFFIISKMDIAKKGDVLANIQKIASLNLDIEIVPLSSRKNDNTDVLLKLILDNMETSDEKNFEFEEDYYTDKPLTFIASETIREKTLFLLNEEIPHGVSVCIVKFNEKDDICFIDADIVCERDSHKSIIIGRHGSMLKNIGELAREELEKLLDKKIMLKLFVKIKKNWRDSSTSCYEVGYKNQDD